MKNGSENVRKAVNETYCRRKNNGKSRFHTRKRKRKGTAMVKQVIIVRKDLGMSVGKTAAQASHASMAFLTDAIRRNARREESPDVRYKAELEFDAETYEGWIGGIFTKVLLEAKNRNALEKAVRKAEEAGMREGEDFFIIRDVCRTELTPEDEDGRTPTCVGFRPMPEERIDPITRKYQLMKG